MIENVINAYSFFYNVYYTVTYCVRKINLFIVRAKYRKTQKIVAKTKIMASFA